MIMRFDDVIYEQLRFLRRIYNRTIEFNGSKSKSPKIDHVNLNYRTIYTNSHWTNK